MALRPSSCLLFLCHLPEERRGPLQSSLLMHSDLRSMSSVGRGDVPLLGSTSTDTMPGQNKLGDRYFYNPVFCCFSIGWEEMVDT